LFLYFFKDRCIEIRSIKKTLNILKYYAEDRNISFVRRTKLKITYIYHSCFSVELEDTILIFDYFKGEIPKFNVNKNIYVFSSHKHHDHFNLSVFREFNRYPKVKYIFSNDIKLNESYLSKNGIDSKVKEKIVNVQANKEYIIDEIKVGTLKSTDLGVAFLVEVEKKNIYHAGDLNWWHWSGEPDEFNVKMESRFKGEISYIKERSFDVAFLPVDSRQEDCFWWGFDYFMQNTRTNVAFPMHFWEQYFILDRLEEIASNHGYRKSVCLVEGDGQQWEV
jgi:L-ascorbate metabolism protein UlaG (beta-lactamase superfamily)